MVKLLHYAILSIGTGAVVFQMVSVRYLFQTFNELKVMHLGIGLVLLALITIKKAFEEKRRVCLHLVFGSFVIAASLIFVVYVKTNYYELVDRLDALPLDIVLAALVIIICMEFTRRFFGKPLVIIILIFVAYSFWGFLLPDPLPAGQGSTDDAVQPDWQDHDRRGHLRARGVHPAGVPQG